MQMSINGRVSIKLPNIEELISLISVIGAINAIKKTIHPIKVPI